MIEIACKAKRILGDAHQSLHPAVEDAVRPVCNPSPQLSRAASLRGDWLSLSGRLLEEEGEQPPGLVLPGPNEGAQTGSS